MDMLDLYKIDGIIYHDAKTCPNNSNCRYGMPQRLEKKSGIPSLTIHGDLNDFINDVQLALIDVNAELTATYFEGKDISPAVYFDMPRQLVSA